MPELSSAGQLVRRVTWFTAACVLISNMIGTGIFGTTGFLSPDIGIPWLILLLWGVGGVFALLGAFCYCELGTAMPRAGGEYVYLREAYGPMCGFLSGWTSFTIGFSAAIAVNAHLFAIHLHQLFPALHEKAAAGAGLERCLFHPIAIGLAMVWGLTCVHVLGVGAGGFLQRVLTVIKVGCIVLIVVGGIAVGKGDWGHLSTGSAPEGLNLTTVLVSFLFVTFAYSGWNAASYIAGEIENPGRNIPRAMIWGTICVGVLYLALNVIYFYAMPASGLASDPAPVAQRSSVAMFGEISGRWIAAMLCLSILGAASAMIWAGPRVYYAMAEDRVFPTMFAKTTKTGHSPARSIVLQSVWVSVLVVAGKLEGLFIYTSFALMIFGALAAGAVIVLRRKRPDLARPYRVFPYPLVPILYLIVSVAVVWAAIELKATEAFWSIITVAAGVPFYFYWKWRAAR